MSTALKNLSSFNKDEVPSGKDGIFGIVVSEWNSEITDALLEGAIETLKENLSDFFSKYPRIYKKYRMEKDKKLIARKISQENHNRAKKLLFKILEEKIEYWWD